MTSTAGSPVVLAVLGSVQPTVSPESHKASLGCCMLVDEVR